MMEGGLCQERALYSEIIAPMFAFANGPHDLIILDTEPGNAPQTVVIQEAHPTGGLLDTHIGPLYYRQCRPR